MFGSTPRPLALLFVALALPACPGDKGDTGDTGTTGVQTTAETDSGSTTSGATGTTTSGATGTTTGGATGTGPATTTDGQGPPGYCPGVPEWEGYQPCREDMDCMHDYEYCTQTPGLGCGPACAMDCVSDDDCEGQDPSFVCEPMDFGCCQGSVCLPPCGPDTCAIDQVCAPDGHCVAQPCDDGWTCLAGSECHWMGLPGDPHGCVALPCDEPGATPCTMAQTCVDGACVALTCTVDADCPCGTCVQGQCYDRPWVCEEPAA